MTTVVFVHGTGVREERYAELFQLFRAKAERFWEGVDVVPCFWGDRLGVPANAAAAVVPDYESVGGGDQSADPWWTDRWILLEADPLYELRLLDVAFPEHDRVELPGTTDTAEDRLATFMGWSVGLGDQSPVKEILDRLGLLPSVFTEGVRAVFGSATARGAIESVSGGEGDGELREALARAVTAATMLAADDGFPGSFPLEASGRDALAAAVLDRFDGADLGLGGTLLKVSGELALRLGGARVIERRRGLIMDLATPFGGDILRYLAHGEAVREFIARTVADVTGPVVLVGHSLGGVAGLDMLRFGLARVDLLVTVGSQGSYLHALGALPSSSGTDAVEMPSWINVYDPRDLLAYLAEPIFGKAVQDVAIASGMPFPRAHSTYFSKDEFYQVVGRRIPR